MPDYKLFGDEHVRQYEATNGQTGYEWNGTKILILRTTGRTTGELRKAPLIFGRDGDDYMIVASKGGAPDHPGWYKNLTAQPNIEIQVKGDVLPVRARTATAEEKARLWPVMVAEWPDYDKYQRSTPRDIPLVILSPRAAG
jgi:deazaflavin-dependent oxidoreductase (nitroreductase family)